MTLNNTKSNNRGFTLVELLIVIVVIAILAAISLVAYNGIQNRSKTTAAQALAANIAKKAEAYNVIYGSYPADNTMFDKAPGTTTSLNNEAKLDDPTKVTSTTPTGETSSTVQYKKCTTGAQVVWWNSTAGKIILTGLGGAPSTAADGSTAGTPTVC